VKDASTATSDTPIPTSTQSAAEKLPVASRIAPSTSGELDESV
jgi:hypothetical protein